MESTRASLTLRLQNADDVEAWDEFAGIYGPVIYQVALSRGFQAADAENLVQEVLMAVAESVTQWLKQEERGSFRAWLPRITRNEDGTAGLWRPSPGADGCRPADAKPG